MQHFEQQPHDRKIQAKQAAIDFNYHASTQLITLLDVCTNVRALHCDDLNCIRLRLNSL